MLNKIIFCCCLVILSSSNESIVEAKQKNNVCKSFEDYFKMEDNPNCWYDSDPELDPIGIIQKYGYPAEVHTVLTDDGFTLTMFRIPRKKARGIVLLQHPALTCGTMWIDKGNESLAFLLHDAKYDVWISNSRGTIYSRTHVNMSVNDTEFWDQTAHDMGVHDVPAQMRLIRNVTKFSTPTIAFIGHSMGGTIPIIYSSMYPKEAADNIKVLIALAPALATKYFPGPLFQLLPYFYKEIPQLVETLNLHILTSGNLSKMITQFCTKVDYGIEFCLRLMYIIMGAGTFDQQHAAQWVPSIFSHNPGGTPTQVFMQYMQNGLLKKFQPYDYGPEKNMKKYNSTQVTEYPVEDIRVPTLIISGDADTIATAKDADEIYQRMKNPNAKKYNHYIMHNFNHFDFAYGKNVIALYKMLVKFLNKVYK